MPFVRDWGAINPFTGPSAYLAGYLNTTKERTGQARQAQARIDAQSAQQYGQSLGNFLNPIAMGGAGMLMQNAGYQVNPAAMMLVGAGINPASVGPGAFGPYSNEAMAARYGTQAMSQYGATPEQLDTLGGNILSSPAAVRSQALASIGYSGEPTEADMPQVKRLLGQNAMLQQRQQLDLQGQIATAQAQEAFKTVAGYNQTYTLTPPYQQQLNEIDQQIAEQQRQYGSDPQLAQGVAQLQRRRFQLLATAPESARVPKAPPDPVMKPAPGGAMIYGPKGWQYQAMKPEASEAPVVGTFPNGTPAMRKGNGDWIPFEDPAIPSHNEYAQLYKTAAGMKKAGPVGADGAATEIPVTADEAGVIANGMYQQAVIQRLRATGVVEQVNRAQQIEEQMQKNAQLQQLMQQVHQQAARAQTQQSVSPGYADVEWRIGNAWNESKGDPAKFAQVANDIITKSLEEKDTYKSPTLAEANKLRRKVADIADNGMPQQPQPQQPARNFQQVAQMPSDKKALSVGQLYTGGARPGVWKYTGLNDKGEPEFMKVSN